MSKIKETPEHARLRGAVAAFTRHGNAEGLAQAREALAAYNTREDVRRGLEAIRSWAVDGHEHLPPLTDEGTALAVTTATLLLNRLNAAAVQGATNGAGDVQ